MLTKQYVQLEETGHDKGFKTRPELQCISDTMVSVEMDGMLSAKFNIVQILFSQETET